MAFMTRAELINAISHRFPQLSREDAAVATKTILDAIADTLCDDSRVEIRGFGSFNLNRLPPRIGRNPSTGDKVEISATAVPRFKVAKELSSRVNRQRVHDG
jgi:integration host factor subunit beta